MDSLRLAWKNLWRNRRRTLITLTAIAFSIMLVQASHNLSFGVYERMVDSGVRAGSGHMAIYRDGYLDGRDEKLDFTVGTLVEQVENLEGVSTVLPRLYIPGLAQSSRESRGILLLGVDPARERQANPFLRELSDEEWLRASSSRDAIIGWRLMDELQIRPGQKFVVTAQHTDGTLHAELLRIRGVVKSGIKDVDSSLIMVGRERAALLSGQGDRIHELAIILQTAKLDRQVFPLVSKMIDVRRDIRAVAWEEAMPNLANAIKLDYASQNFIFLVILAIVTIGVVNTLLMSVMERLHEFGVILALGSTPLRLRATILIEACLLGGSAAILGSILGTLLTWYLWAVGINMETFISGSLEFGGVIFDPVMRATWDIVWMVKIALYVAGLTLLAALYPAIKAGRITPVEAMRHH